MQQLIPEKIFDGDYEIIYSNVFNVYQNKLTFRKIDNFEVIFEFIADKSKKHAILEITGDDDSKKVYIKLYNFNNSLGLGTTEPVKFLKTNEGRDILFSIHAKSLNQTTTFLQVSITFYLK